MKHLNINVSGRVQGIGFRKSVANHARYLGIKGYVKNLNDGSVFIEAEGDQIPLAQFVKWCRNGTDYSQIEHLNIEEDLLIGFKSFDVRY